jgi:hypothetical protein
VPLRAGAALRVLRLDSDACARVTCVTTVDPSVKAPVSTHCCCSGGGDAAQAARVTQRFDVE